MRQIRLFLSVLICALVVVGCAQQPKSANSKEAIDYAKTLETVDAQAKYLVSEAQAFISSEQYEEAINTAKHIISNTDFEAYKAQAQSILEEAKAELEALAKAKAEEAKKAMTDKINSLGK